jgi:hypothetical protein
MSDLASLGNLYRAQAAFDPTPFVAAGECVAWLEARADIATGFGTSQMQVANTVLGTAVSKFARSTVGLQPSFVQSYGNSGLSALLFDGNDDSLLMQGTTSHLVDLMGTSNDFTWISVQGVVSISTNSGTSYLNDSIMGDSGGYLSIDLRNNVGGNNVVLGGGFGAGDVYILAGSEPVITLNTVFMVTYRHHSSTLFVQKNMDTAVSGSDGGAPALTNTSFTLGTGNSQFANMNWQCAGFFNNGNLTNLVALQTAIMNRWKIT